MNLGKTNLFFGYLHIISAFVLAILSYLNRKEIKFNTKLYTYGVDGIVEDSELLDTNPKIDQRFNISTQTIQILIVVMFCVAGLFHLFYYTNGFYTRLYLADIRSGYNRYRWLEFSITSSIMVFILSVLAGIKDLYTIILTCVMIASACGFGFFIERSKLKSDKTIGLFSGGGVIATILAILYSSYFSLRDETKDKGGKNEDWVMGVLIGSGIIFVISGLLTILYVGGYQVEGFNYVFYEKLYTYISFLSKAYLGYYTFFGILKE